MTNDDFLRVLEESYKVYLQTGARSNAKLNVLHGAIANDLSKRLTHNYFIRSLGFEYGKEGKISGRYMDKNVDIAIYRGNDSLAGIAVKYIMSNYSQNSNNYFENMLGETANLRSNGKGYFQIVVIPKSLPYFTKDGHISKVEKLKEHHLLKYINLSGDNIDDHKHIPTKTLLYLIEMPEIDVGKICNREQLKTKFLYGNAMVIKACKDKYDFKDSVIYNDYEKFIEKVKCYIEFL